MAPVKECVLVQTFEKLLTYAESHMVEQKFLMPLSSHLSFVISFVKPFAFHQLLLFFWFPWLVFAEKLCRSELKLEKDGGNTEVNLIFQTLVRKAKRAMSLEGEMAFACH